MNHLRKKTDPARGLQLIAFLAMLVTGAPMFAETGANAWLRYAAPPDPPRYHEMPHAVLLLGDAPEEHSAGDELDRGLGHMISGTDVLLRRFRPDVDAIVLGTTAAIHQARLTRQITGFHEQPLPEEGFRIVHLRNGIRQWWVIQGGSPRAELYGAFRFMALVAQDRQLPEELTEAPAAAVRWVSQWDCLDGSVERGYAGASIFYEDGHARSDLRRVGEYGRLLASVGINGLVLGPPAGQADALTAERLRDAARIADELRPWGVRLALSTPPLAGSAAESLHGNGLVSGKSWQAGIDALYQAIPDAAGLSLSMPVPTGSPTRSPLTPETIAAAARALSSHGGTLLVRAGHADTPTAVAALSAQDGKLPTNVIVQISAGPSALAMRGSVSPLTAALRHTPQVMELQITQEFTGQQRAMVYLPPLWKDLLDTDLRADNQASPARGIVSGKLFGQKLGGFIGVANVGGDVNWLHHPMALANLYAFGRMAWDPLLVPAGVLDEWTRMTWSNDGRVYQPIESMQMESWKAWEDSTLPFGLGMPAAAGDARFGPIPRALTVDREGIGVERASGMDLAALYPPQLAAIYGSPQRCPPELLLFFHRVAASAAMPGGNASSPIPGGNASAPPLTVIQAQYDAHYAGASAMQTFVDAWESVRDLTDEARYDQVLQLLQQQAHHAEVWRDSINEALLNATGTPDALGYVGRHPGRVEAETMAGMGFRSVDATAGGAASSGRAAVCTAARCSLHTVFQGEANPYRAEVGYFDRQPGEASYRLLVNGTEEARWKAGEQLPPQAAPDSQLDGTTAVRFVVNGLRLKPGDVLTLEATPDRQDIPAVDFIEITRDPRWN